MSWLQTVRSAVNRWEIDNTEHFTVAFYFARLGDAAFAMLDTLGLSPSAAHTSDMYVRFQRELRVGDIFHIDTGVIDLGDDSLLLGHKIFDSGDGALTTTVEHRLRTAVTPDVRKKADAHRVSWDGPKREARPQVEKKLGYIWPVRFLRRRLAIASAVVLVVLSIAAPAIAGPSLAAAPTARSVLVAINTIRAGHGLRARRRPGFGIGTTRRVPAPSDPEGCG